MTTLKGEKPFFKDDLTLANFNPKRITKLIETAEDLDKAKISYQIDVRHVNCLSRWVLHKILLWDDGYIAPQPISTFNDRVYFHPNIRIDGWHMLQSRYLEFRATDDEFPACPLQPKFWEHGVSGSAIYRWPPSFFNDWITLIQNGGSLELDPASSAIAGPSGTTLTLSPIQSHSPIAGPSHPSHPPSHSPSYSPPSPLSNITKDLENPALTLHIKMEMIEDADLEVSHSDNHGTVDAQLHVDGFELLSIGPGQQTSQPLISPPGSPGSPAPGLVDERGDETKLWSQAGPITDADIENIEY